MQSKANFGLKKLFANVLIGAVVGLVMAKTLHGSAPFTVGIGVTTSILAWLFEGLRLQAAQNYIRTHPVVEDSWIVEIRAFKSNANREKGSRNYKHIGIASDPIQLERLIDQALDGNPKYQYLDYYVHGKSLGGMEFAMRHLGAVLLDEELDFWVYQRKLL